MLLLIPSQEGTQVQVAADDKEIRELLRTGLTPAEVVIPKSKPDKLDELDQLDFFR